MAADPVVQRFIENHADNAARLLESAGQDEMLAFMATLSTEQAASIVRHLVGRSACHYLSTLDTEQAMEIIKVLPVQYAAALLRELPMPVKKAILNCKGVPRTINAVLRFPKDSVGAEMDSNPVTLNDGMTVKQARTFLKKYRDNISDPLFVTGSEQQFIGVIALKDLLLAENSVKVSLLCKPSIHKFLPRESLESAGKSPAWKQAQALPVVERGGRLSGILNRERLQEILAGEPDNPAHAAAVSDSIISLSELFWITCADLLPDYNSSDQHGSS